ncbi:MAG: FadR/GntR family transcriptional regulator [Pseudolabrys sp.]
MDKRVDDHRPADRAADLTSLVDSVRGLAATTGLGSERALADKLNVKRHQLRRALQVLRDNGEIAPAEPKRKALGARNGESLVQDTNPLEVVEMRIAIEPFLARLAALRASPLEMARIERAATTLAGTDSGAADLRFHKAIAAASGNNLAVAFYGMLRQVASDARMRLGRNQPACPKRIQQRDDEHRAIATAITARDADGAEQAMRMHLAAVQKRVIEHLHPLTAAM